MAGSVRVRWLAAPPSLDLAHELAVKDIELVVTDSTYDVVVVDPTSWPLGVNAAVSAAVPLLLVVDELDVPVLDAFLARLPTTMAVESVRTHPALLARRMRQLATSPEFETDPLTGVGNRRGLQRWLARNAERELVVIELDVDHMKHINDRWGPEVGDQVLAGVAVLLEQHVPRGGYVARLGDDDFVVAAVRGETEPALLAEFLRQGATVDSLRPGPPHVGEELRVTLSAGVTSGDEPGEVMLQQAHLAVIAAKARGRDRSVDFDAMRLAASGAFEERAFEDMTVLAAQRAAELITSGGRQMLSLLRDEAETDPLTGLPNRRYFNKKLEFEARASAEQGYPVSVIWVDVDHFGNFNKRFSYVVGDSVLRHVAQRLRELTGEAGWVARWGGEEFAVVLAHCRLDEAMVLAERLRAGVEVEDFVPEDRRRMGVTISAGVAQLAPGEQLRSFVERLSLGVALAKERRNEVRAAPEPAAG
jgi:diguanylate cyclase (GGDEF)-like protein